MDTRIAILTSVGVFDNIASDTIRWTVIFEKVQVTRLYATCPSISRPRRATRGLGFQQACVMLYVP